MNELKPCPFCGVEAEVVWLDSVYIHGFVARCANAECIIVAETDIYPTEAEAVEAWNTRAERTCRIEKIGDEWHCSCCGEMVGCDDPWCELFINGNAVELWNHCPNCGAKVTER